jgi:hypothetical protein
MRITLYDMYWSFNRLHYMHSWIVDSKLYLRIKLFYRLFYKQHHRGLLALCYFLLHMLWH